VQKTDVNNTALAIFFLAIAVMLIGGLAVIPALEEAEAACELFKKNGDPCKPKKPKKH
jgi:hypothetical protein